jgi:hypothetical protein
MEAKPLLNILLHMSDQDRSTQRKEINSQILECTQDASVPP